MLILKLFVSNKRKNDFYCVSQKIAEKVRQFILILNYNCVWSWVAQGITIV